MLRETVAAEVPVLGLCFGGQALSAALGAGIRVLDEPEIGWIPMTSSDARDPRGPVAAVPLRPHAAAAGRA